MKVLAVDDERSILDIVAVYLEKSGHEVIRAESGEEALEQFYHQAIDFVVLDIMLPDLSGWEICEKIRLSSTVPIILLTAKSTEADVIKGLKMGADDYIVKPFSPKELMARIETVSRRFNPANGIEKWSFHNEELIIFPKAQEVKVEGNDIPLTTTEFRLLKTMASHPQQVFTRDQLLESIKGLEASALDRVIDSHIKNMRAKLEKNPKKPQYILTVHGTGYRFGGDQ